MIRVIMADGDRALLSAEEEFHMIAVEIELKNGDRFSLAWDNTLRVRGVVMPLAVHPIASNAIDITGKPNG